MTKVGSALVFRTLLHFRWKQFSRSPQFGQRLAMRILGAFIGLYFLLNLLFVGYFLPLILEKSNPGANIPELVNQYILHFFLALLLVRYFMQKMPAVQLQTFLALPVRKSRLILAYFALLGLHAFNFVPIIVALPLWVQKILPAYPIAQSLLWLTGILLLSLASAALVLLVKIFAFDRPLIFATFLLIVVGLFMLDQLPVLAILPALSSGVFDQLLVGNWFVLLGLATGSSIIVLVLFRILHNQLYLSEGKSSRSRNNCESIKIKSARFGKIWLLLKVELRLLWRNRVPRASLLFVFVSNIVVLGILYQETTRPNWSFFTILFMSMLGIGQTSIIPYGSALFSWEGRHFDGLLVRSFFSSEFINSKLSLLITAFSIPIFLFSLLFIKIKSEYVIFVLAVFIYAASWLTFSLVYAGFYHRRAFALNGSIMATGGWQGKTVWNLLKVLIFIIPYGFFVSTFEPSAGFNSIKTVIICLYILGFFGLLAFPWWRKILINTFQQQKYAMAEGFRQS